MVGIILKIFRKFILGEIIMKKKIISIFGKDLLLHGLFIFKGGTTGS